MADQTPQPKMTTPPGLPGSSRRAQELPQELLDEIAERERSDRADAAYKLAQTAYRLGYAQAVARLRDDARYRDWWSSSPESVRPTEPIRGHLADYLETVGPDGKAVTLPDGTLTVDVAEQAAATQQPSYRAFLGENPCGNPGCPCRSAESGPPLGNLRKPPRPAGPPPVA